MHTSSMRRLCPWRMSECWVASTPICLASYPASMTALSEEMGLVYLPLAMGYSGRF